MTDETSRAMYGTTMVCDGHHSKVPYAMVLLGRAPFLEAGEAILRALSSMTAAGVTAVALGAAISHVLCDVPLPPRGRKTVQFMVGHYAIEVARPALNEPPCGAEDRGFKILFDALSVENIVTVRPRAKLNRYVDAVSGFVPAAIWPSDGGMQSSVTQRHAL